MVLYVAIVAILNIGLGYALAVYLDHGRRSRASQDFDSNEQFDDASEYSPDDYDAEAVEHSEFEVASSR